MVLMNRDEQRCRPRACPPESTSFASVRAVYPREAGGGTWIAATDTGVVFALLNWSVQAPRISASSRGRIIPALLAGDRHDRPLQQWLKLADLLETNPFRLLRFDVHQGEVEEFQWNGGEPQTLYHPWVLAHWFSSGWSESEVVATRQRTAEAAKVEADHGTIAWARRLHAGHQPKRDAHSICMHRTDARTVSQTEVRVSVDEIEMEYRAGSPCNPCSPPQIINLTRRK